MPSMGSLAFRSEFKYGIKKSNPFCSDPLKYVVKTDLNALYDFEKFLLRLRELSYLTIQCPIRRKGI